jgi:hypothetical protein
MHAICSAIVSGSSCSHTRMGIQPPSVSAWSSAWSRARFRSNLAFQKSTLVRGIVAWTGHRCQKHPSTNTATRDGPKTISGRTQRPEVSMRLSFRKRRPRACNADRNRRSGPVSVRRFACMVRGPRVSLGSDCGQVARLVMACSLSGSRACGAPGSRLALASKCRLAGRQAARDPGSTEVCH